MKLEVSLITAILLTSFLYGQKLEYTIHLNTGLFFYTGNELMSTTFLNSALPYDVSNAHAIVLTRTHSGFSYDGSAGIQKITKKNAVCGTELGGQSLQSRIHIMEGTDNSASKKAMLTWETITSIVIFLPATGSTLKKFS